MPRRSDDDTPTGASSEDEPIDGPAAARTPLEIAEPPSNRWDGPRAVPYAQADAVDGMEWPDDDPDLPFWLALHRVKGIGPARFNLLLDAFGTAEAVWQSGSNGWLAAGLDTRTAAAFEVQRKGIVPEAELERLRRLRVTALRITDDRYPRLLREVPLPPPILYVRGALLPADDVALAIVGTRRATTYGRQVTERLTAELIQQGLTIVSGLARGIDTYAHAAALEAGGRTLAVLGCGPDLVYPPENAKLAARIIEGGAIVTEFAPGTQPEAGNFPARNRLISGLSLGVLVIEAPENSGALITARFAGEQGRDVFAVPGSITSRASMGANRLIQDGAKLVQTVDDVLSELNLSMVPQQLDLRELMPENETEARLLSQLDTAGEPCHIDELCRATGLPIAAVSGTLVMMELKGLVRLSGPMTYVRDR
ncbi:MAG TPA: DNA-processing protein DprA [Ktedonobacterales bacterium]|nr:DNA-processing protein DprA [Ktedonobacterales bacterium]